MILKKNKKSQSQRFVGYFLSLQIGTDEEIRSKLLCIKPILSNKKGVSQIISVVFLILVSVVSVLLIANFFIPYIKDTLSESDCLDALGMIEIENDPKYTCFDSVGRDLNIQIHFGENESLNGFVLELEGDSFLTFFIEENSIPPEISMYNGGVFEFPGKNEERSYRIDLSNNFINAPRLIRIYPILNDQKICDSPEELNEIITCT